MNIEIFDPKSDADKTLRLRLIKTDKGAELVAVHEDGCDIPFGHLLSIQHGGDIYLHKGVRPDLGLKLADDGRVRIATHLTR